MPGEGSSLQSEGLTVLLVSFPADSDDPMLSTKVAIMADNPKTFKQRLSLWIRANVFKEYSVDSWQERSGNVFEHR